VSRKWPSAQEQSEGQESIHTEAVFCGREANNLIGALKVGGISVEIQLSQMMCSDVPNYRQIIDSAAITSQVA
jgi:hypothetical protein